MSTFSQENRKTGLSKLRHAARSWLAGLARNISCLTGFRSRRANSDGKERNLPEYHLFTETHYSVRRWCVVSTGGSGVLRFRFQLGRAPNRSNLSGSLRHSRRLRFPKMIVQELMPASKRIIGLFPELLGFGGVQEAGRMTAAALQEIALQHSWSTDFLSLNDPPGAHCFEADDRIVSVYGFGRGKIHFLLSGENGARRSASSATSIVLAGHPNLSVVSSGMHRTSAPTDDCHGTRR